MIVSAFRSAPSAFKRVCIALAFPAFLTACPGGGGGVAPPLSGVATNGHLNGATVTCDAEGSTTTTDANGAFTFPTGCVGSITVSGGINVDTGEEFLGELKAPAGATAVNSLTTMMVAGGLTEDEVKTSLGIPSSVNLLTTDPAASSGANYSNSELFTKAKTVQQLFQTTMDSVATNTSLTDTNTDKEANIVTKAGYAVIGDLHKIVPAISEEIRRRRG
jgi:hypothetical protein